MLKARKFAVLAACAATLALTPAAFAQVMGGYAVQLGQTAGAARQMPSMEPRVGYGPQDWHAPASSASQPQNHHQGHHEVRSDDDDDSAADAPADRSVEWTQVK